MFFCVLFFVWGGGGLGFEVAFCDYCLCSKLTTYSSCCHCTCHSYVMFITDGELLHNYYEYYYWVLGNSYCNSYHLCYGCNTFVATVIVYDLLIFVCLLERMKVHD